MLQDLVTAAVNDGAAPGQGRPTEEKMARVTGGLQLPGMPC